MVCSLNMTERFKAISSVYMLMIKDQNILLLRRCNTGYCDGMYGLPAGHVEAGESVRQGMIREAREEVGIDFLSDQLHVVHLRSRNASDGHRIDHFFRATEWDGEVQNKEPGKCDDLSWFPLSALPENTIPYIRDVIERVERADVYSEEGWV